jgi:hypothetical protein
VLSWQCSWKKVEIGSANQIIRILDFHKLAHEATESHPSTLGVFDAHAHSRNYVEQINQSARAGKVFEEFFLPLQSWLRFFSVFAMRQKYNIVRRSYKTIETLRVIVSMFGEASLASLREDCDAVILRN